jgi:drug/metabolite transporter (DMT)-like permease
MTDKNKGILHILASAFCFALMTFFVRLAGDVPFFQKAFFRNIVAFFVAAVMLMRTEEKFKMKKGSLPILLLRAGCGCAGLLCNFYAIDKLNISDANMLNKLSPFFAIIFSTFILKEKANKKEWLTVLVAFAGALFVMKPSFNVEFIPALVGALGGLGAGAAYTFVRLLGKRGERGPLIVFFFSGFSTLVTLPYIIFAYHPMELWQWAVLILAGVAAMGGQLNITAAYSYAPAKEISVFDYSQVIFAAILGFIFLAQVPDVWSIVGYLLIIGAAVFRWMQNKKAD